ncbi:hydroxyethylthiazole kinase [Cetobacterium sp.]|uniref:hydroxyethylthiazole kinase n=1 Tax=Cetobacterium sp. TaxID=2071632 RepID=UPI003F327F49
MSNLINEVVSALKNVKKNTPLVFHLTNSVTINDCANVTLALGGSPLMSFCIEEIEEIIEISSSVVLNIGTMEKEMVQIALEVGKIANRLNKPIILDPVGVGATRVRKDLVQLLLKNVKFSVIKGNLAEIKALLGLDSSSRGVDSLEEGVDGEKIAILASQKFETIVAITGEIDFISDSKSVVKILNGNDKMSLVTGTGCMISSLIGTFLGAQNSSYTSAIAGVLAMGVAGDLASLNFIGSGSLKISIIDNISNLDENILLLNSKIFL